MLGCNLEALLTMFETDPTVKAMCGISDDSVIAQVRRTLDVDQAMSDALDADLEDDLIAHLNRALSDDDDDESIHGDEPDTGATLDDDVEKQLAEEKDAVAMADDSEEEEEDEEEEEEVEEVEVVEVAPEDGANANFPLSDCEYDVEETAGADTDVADTEPEPPSAVALRAAAASVKDVAEQPALVPHVSK